MSTATPLRVLPRTEPKSSGWEYPALTRAMEALGSRWASSSGRRRYATRAQVRAALDEVAQVVAIVAMHAPLKTRRDRAFQDELDPVFAALDRVCGRCPNCGRRLRAGVRIHAEGRCRL